MTSAGRCLDGECRYLRASGPRAERSSKQRENEERKEIAPVVGQEAIAFRCKVLSVGQSGLVVIEPMSLNDAKNWWAGTGFNRRHQDFQSADVAGS